MQMSSSPNSPSLLFGHGLISDTKNLCASYSTNDATACQAQPSKHRLLISNSLLKKIALLKRVSKTMVKGHGVEY